MAQERVVLGPGDDEHVEHPSSAWAAAAADAGFWRSAANGSAAERFTNTTPAATTVTAVIGAIVQRNHRGNRASAPWMIGCST